MTKVSCTMVRISRVSGDPLRVKRVLCRGSLVRVGRKVSSSGGRRALIRRLLRTYFGRTKFRRRSRSVVGHMSVILCRILGSGGLRFKGASGD